METHSRGYCRYNPQPAPLKVDKITVHRIIRVGDRFMIIYEYVDKGELLTRIYENFKSAMKCVIDWKNYDHCSPGQIDALFLNDRIEF
jgi:hypothetical protein